MATSETQELLGVLRARYRASRLGAALHFAEALVDYDAKSDRDAFAEIVTDAVQLYGVPTARIADEVGVTTTTVLRWASGKNQPSRFMIQGVVGFIQAWCRKGADDDARSEEITLDIEWFSGDGTTNLRKTDSA